MGFETVIADVIAISVFLGAIIAIVTAARSFKRTTSKIDLFLEDWYGEAPREGIEPRPGVLARLHNLEDSRQANSLMLSSIQDTVNKIQSKVEHELDNNSGGSTKDAAQEALRVAKAVLASQEKAAEEQALFRSQYLHDQQVSRQEWEAVFDTVKSMIGKPIDEQMTLWTSAARSYRDLEDDGA